MHRVKVAGVRRINCSSSSRIRILSGSPRMQTVVFMITMSFFLLSIGLLSVPWRKHHEVGFRKLDNPSPLKNDIPTDVDGLINKIRATTETALRGRNASGIFTPSMQALWYKENLCRSRHEIHSLYTFRRVANDVHINSKWRLVLKEYEALHRTCVIQMGDVTQFFKKKMHIKGCKFVVAGVSSGSGIGNKALSIVSALVYSILTQRVLLVPLVTAVPGVFCEPFEGSSWMVDPEQVWAESKKRRDLWGSLKDFYQKIDERVEGDDSKISPIYASSTTEDWDAQPEPRFFCDTEQAHYTKVEWINFRNNLYFVPKLFAVPSFKPVLEELFPDRNVLTHLLRSVMLPCDPVWERVKQVHDAHFRHAHKRVGVQVRYFHGKVDFDLLHTVTEEKIEQCLLQQGFVPNPKLQADDISTYKAALPAKAPLNVTTVFITSLYLSLFDRLTKSFVRTALETGDAVGLVQLTHEDKQYFGVEVDRQALTELLCLSLTDHLILTPQSTFGALAQGYGALVPWFVDLRSSTSTPCVRAQTAETCYQIPASKNYTCPHDINMNGKLIYDVVPYIADCHLVEEPFYKVNGAGLGMQLITSYMPN